MDAGRNSEIIRGAPFDKTETALSQAPPRATDFLAGTPPAPGSSRGLSKERGAPPLSQEYVGRDRFEKVTPNPVKVAAEEPVSTFSIDVDPASYAFVRRALNNGHLPQKNAVRIEELINYFDYDYPPPRERSTPFRSTVTVFPTPWSGLKSGGDRC